MKNKPFTDTSQAVQRCCREQSHCGSLSGSHCSGQAPCDLQGGDESPEKAPVHALEAHEEVELTIYVNNVNNVVEALFYIVECRRIDCEHNVEVSIDNYLQDVSDGGPLSAAYKTAIAEHD